MSSQISQKTSQISQNQVKGMPEFQKLPEKDKKFVLGYLYHKNAKKAMIEAGYPESSIKNYKRTLQNKKVSQVLELVLGNVKKSQIIEKKEFSGDGLIALSALEDNKLEEKTETSTPVFSSENKKYEEEDQLAALQAIAQQAISEGEFSSAVSAFRQINEIRKDIIKRKQQENRDTQNITIVIKKNYIQDLDELRNKLTNPSSK